MFSKLLVVMAVVVVKVNAQGILGNLTACAIQCVALAAGADNCTLPTVAPTGAPDPATVACLCENGQFITDAGACLGANCPSADVQAALNLQSSVCTNAGTTLLPTSNATTTKSLPFSALPTNSNATTTGTGTSSGGSSGATTTGTATGTTSGTGSVPSSVSASESSPAESTSTASAANSLTNNNVVAAFFALITGFLAI